MQGAARCVCVLLTVCVYVCASSEYMSQRPNGHPLSTLLPTDDLAVVLKRAILAREVTLLQWLLERLPPQRVADAAMRPGQRAAWLRTGAWPWVLGYNPAAVLCCVHSDGARPEAQVEHLSGGEQCHGAGSGCVARHCWGAVLAPAKCASNDGQCKYVLDLIPCTGPCFQPSMSHAAAPTAGY